MTRAVPQAAIDLVKQVEGLRLAAYQDVAGVWTIGYGSTKRVTNGDVITQAQAEAMLADDLGTAAERLAGVVDEAVILLLTDNQYSALLSFVFNLGANPSWTIWKVLNAKQFDQVPQQLIRFVYAGNPPVKVQGLVNRRTAEINLFSLDEPGSVDTSPSSSVTRTTATPAVPTDPKPTGIRLAIGTAATVAAGAIPQAQNAVKAISEAITPYESFSTIVGHWLSLAGVAGAGLAIAYVGVKYLQDRTAKSWGKTSAPALHPTVLTSTAKASTMSDTLGAATVASVSTAQPVAAAPAAVPAAPSKPFDLLADIEATAKSLAQKLGADVTEFETAIDLRARLATLGAFLKKVEAGLA